MYECSFLFELSPELFPLLKMGWFFHNSTDINKFIFNAPAGRLFTVWLAILELRYMDVMEDGKEPEVFWDAKEKIFFPTHLYKMKPTRVLNVEEIGIDEFLVADPIPPEDLAGTSSQMPTAHPLTPMSHNLTTSPMPFGGFGGTPRPVPSTSAQVN